MGAIEEGKQAIHWACTVGSKDIVELLVDVDEDCLGALCKHNHTPFYYAIHNGLTPELGSLLTQLVCSHLFSLSTFLIIILNPIGK